MRVLFAHDKQLFRDGIKSYLETIPNDDGVCRKYQVLTADSFDDALDMACHDAFNAILVGLDLPGMNRGAGLQSLRNACPTTGLGVVSGQNCSLDIMARLIDCAASVIPESLSGAQFVLALDNVAGGQPYLPVSAARSSFRTHRRHSGESATSKNLTPRESEVVDHLVQGLSNKEIARNLAIEEVTVRLHLRGIYRKLEARNRVQAVTAAIELGLGPRSHQGGLRAVM